MGDLDAQNTCDITWSNKGTNSRRSLCDKQNAHNGFLPVGSAVAFQIPFTQGGEEGAIVIQANGTLIGIIDWYMGIEKRGTVIYNNVSLTATGITPRRFSEIISASWLNNLGWKVTESVVPGARHIKPK